MRGKSRGFSLIELLIVVAIILIIAAIAIPDLLKSRQAANQASAVGSLRTINTSEVTYSSTYTTGFSSSLDQLDGAAGAAASINTAGLIDSILGGGTYVKSNYAFMYNPNPWAAVPTCTAPQAGSTQIAAPATTPINAYYLNALPTQCTGNGNYYFTDQSGVVRQDSQAVASPGDPPLAG